MGFGFGTEEDDDKEDSGKPKELTYIYTDTLKCMKWGEITEDMRVKSVLTRVEGSVSEVFLEHSMKFVIVNWDNGNCSRVKKSDLNKVIRI